MSGVLGAAAVGLLSGFQALRLSGSQCSDHMEPQRFFIGTERGDGMYLPYCTVLYGYVSISIDRYLWQRLLRLPVEETVPYTTHYLSALHYYTTSLLHYATTQTTQLFYTTKLLYSTLLYSTCSSVMD